jgi:hypothetical protein
MPSGPGPYYGPNLSPLYRAWEEHYMRKGCSRRKAESLTMRLILYQGRRNWPPG